MPQRTNGSQKRWPWRQPSGHTSATASHQPSSLATYCMNACGLRASY